MSLVLGLDISSGAVRGAFLRTSLRSAEIEQYAESPVPRAENEERQAEAVEAAVRDVITQSQRPPDRIVAALDGRAVSLRIIDLPGGVAKRVSELLASELEPLLPFDVEDAVVDYQIIEQNRDEIRILAAAAPSTEVGQQLALLRNAGAEARELAVGAAAFDALSVILPESYVGKTVLVVDIGQRSTDCAVVRDGNCLYARTLSGGMDLVEGGQRDALAASLKRTVAGYRAQSDRAPDLVFLAGDAAPMNGAIEWLTEQLGLPVELAPLPEADGGEQPHLPKFTKAVALAARGRDRKRRLDMRQGEFASTAAAGQLRQQLKLVAVCAAAILLSFGFSVLARYRVAKAENAELSAKLAEVSKDLLSTETSSPVRARELLEAGPTHDDPLPRFDAYDALEALSAAIPTGVAHETRRLLVEIDDESKDGRVELQGTLSSIAERDQIADALVEHDCFGEINKGSISSAPEDRKHYKIELKIECPSNRAPKDKEGGRGTR